MTTVAMIGWICEWFIHLTSPLALSDPQGQGELLTFWFYLVTQNCVSVTLKCYVITRADSRQFLSHSEPFIGDYLPNKAVTESD